MAIKKEQFGSMPDGRKITLYTITNEHGVSASFLDLGAIWANMLVPDRNGQVADVLLGYDDAAGFLVNGPHLGSVVGRIANRTAGARFSLNDNIVYLGRNDGENNLHSGPDYFDKRLWNVGMTSEHSIQFTLESPDGDQGYPGHAAISVTYTLTEDNTVEILYQAVCDQDTPMNLTNHAYFNLGGHGSGVVYDHFVQIDADTFTPTNQESIPTGEFRSVFDTPFDFSRAKKIGADIHADDMQLKMGKGYDHNYCLNHPVGIYSRAASVWDEKSGRAMDVYTDLPGIQFYTANWLDHESGKDGTVYCSRGAFCFETQFFPDSVNQPKFMSPVVKAGETFVSKTGYHFYWK